MEKMKTAIVLLQLIAAHGILTLSSCSKSALCQRELESRRIEDIKHSILNSLHMANPPSSDIAPSDELREEYMRMYEQIDQQKENTQTEVLFIPAKDPSNGRNPSQLISTFDMAHNWAITEILNATLVFQASLSGKTVESVYVEVFEKRGDGSIGELLSAQSFSVSGNERLAVSLPKEAVSRWYMGYPVAGIFVSAVVGGHNIAIHPQQTTKDHENMILQLTVMKGKRSRRHVSVPVCAKKEPSEGCCLYDLMIDFKEIGWNWVIAPAKYNAYMCRGDCRHNAHHFGGIAHSKIMKGAHQLPNADPQLNSVAFCCHPTEYDDMQLVYVGSDKVVTTIRLEGMVARRCSCS